MWLSCCPGSSIAPMARKMFQPFILLAALAEDQYHLVSLGTCTRVVHIHTHTHTHCMGAGGGETETEGQKNRDREGGQEMAQCLRTPDDLSLIL